MPNVATAEALVLSLLPLVLVLLAVYWVVRLAVAAGMRSALSDPALRERVTRDDR